MARGTGVHGWKPLTDEEKRDKPQITLALLQRVFSYLLPYWPRLLLVFLAIIVSALFGLLPSILVGRIIDQGLIGRDFDTLLLLIGASMAVLLISNLIGVVESYLNIWVAQRITFDMRNQMYAHLQRMSQRFFTTNRQGEIITRMTSDINGVQSVISSTLTNILSNTAIIVTSAVTMYQKNWLLATVGMTILPLFIAPTKKLGNTRWSIASASQEKDDQVNQVLNETLNVSGQLLVKLFANERWEYQRYETLNREMTALNIKESMAGRWFRVAINTFTNMGPMLIYLTGGILIIRYGQTNLTVGDITVMVALLNRMYLPVNLLMNIQVEVIRSMALFTRIFSYFDMPVEIRNKPDAVIPDQVRGDLVFDRVQFHYDPGQPILWDISFHIPAGQSVAIVGPSGAGKSTIINLIPRLYDVTGGRILLDGRDIRDLDLDFLRNAVGVVTQDTYLFNGTIRENLLYANRGASEAEMVQACREANIHDFIAGLPAGYDTLVGNRGIKLSGGEKQRVSIARVILKNPRLLLFDEATSSLDSISEDLIQQATAPLLAARTSLIIAHRLSTIMSADTILVVRQGEIVEQGRHEDLVAAGGVYQELYETQFRRAIEEHGQRKRKIMFRIKGKNILAHHQN